MVGVAASADGWLIAVVFKHRVESDKGGGCGGDCEAVATGRGGAGRGHPEFG